MIVSPATIPSDHRSEKRPVPAVERADLLLFLSRHTGGMRIGAGQSRIQFALLSRLGATSGTSNNQGCFFPGFHDSIMRGCSAVCWSIVTGSGSLVCLESDISIPNAAPDLSGKGRVLPVRCCLRRVRLPCTRPAQTPQMCRRLRSLLCFMTLSRFHIQNEVNCRQQKVGPVGLDHERIHGL